MRTGLVLVWECVGLCVEFGDGAGAALAESSERAFETGSDDECTCAERAEETFVTGYGEEVDVECLDIDGYVSDGLCGIDDEWYGEIAADSTDFGDGLYGSGDIACVDDGDEACVVSNGGADVLRIDDSGGGVDGDA